MVFKNEKILITIPINSNIIEVYCIEGTKRSPKEDILHYNFTPVTSCKVEII